MKRHILLVVVLAALLMNGCTPSSNDESSVDSTLSSEEMRIKEDLDMYDALIMRFMDADSNTLNEKQLTVAALITFDAEMMNGGLCQFFVNDYSGYAQYVSDALGDVGAVEMQKHYSSFVSQNGKYFGFTGAEWVEVAEIDSTRKPWLAEFTWDENIVAYMDTLTDKDGECVMLRVDEQYIDSDEYDPHYFLFFNFDTDGNFVNAKLQVNLFRDNEINITESIASLDAEEINAEIQKEYQNAIG